jgi:hypothetical protein
MSAASWLVVFLTDGRETMTLKLEYTYFKQFVSLWTSVSGESFKYCWGTGMGGSTELFYKALWEF